MSRYFLTRIRIEGFRGINNENQPLELKFKPDSVNSVFAANATGKSSIFEALCYAIRGHIPKLRALQAGEQPEKYVANLFHSTNTAVVEIELEDEAAGKHTIRVTRTPSGQRVVDSPSGATDPDAILKSLDEDFTLLDYEQFNSFINITPLERGRSFAALLGLSGYSQLRQLLQNLSDTRNLNADFDLPSLQTSARENENHAKETFGQFRSAYTSLTGQSPGDVSDVARWGADIRGSLVSIELLRPVIGERKLSEIDFAELREVVRGQEGGPKRDELRKLVESTTRLGALTLVTKEAAGAEADEINREVGKRAELLSATPGPGYQRLQDAALHLYKSSEWHDPNRCALCQTELTTPLLPKIEAEVARFEAVRAQEGVIRNLVDNSEWLGHLLKLEGMEELKVALTDRAAEGVRLHAQRGSLTTEIVSNALGRYEALIDKLKSEVGARNDRRAELEKELPPSLVAVTTQIEFALNARENLAGYWRATNTVTKVRSKLAKYERWQKYIAAVTDEICDAEARLTAARLGSLGDEYKELFQNVMGVGDVVPVLARSDQGEQLDVQLENFHGLQGLSARALLSESYRNALAVSVFLSAAGQQTTAARFVVLDDVTSSFDAGHQWRLMDEIRGRLQHRKGQGGLQFILLSHDGLLEKYFDKVAGGTDWHHQRLQGWPPLGAVSTVGQEADRLRKTAADFLAAGQVKEAEPLIRQYLEFTLLKIIRKLNVPVPYDLSIRDQLQMVGNCVDAIVTAVKLQGAAGGLILTPTQVSDLDGRYVPALVSNWLSHYSTSVTANLSPPVLLGVLQSADDLVDCFKWEDTSTTPATKRWYRSLTSKK